MPEMRWNVQMCLSLCVHVCVCECARSIESLLINIARVPARNGKLANRSICARNFSFSLTLLPWISNAQVANRLKKNQPSVIIISESTSGWQRDTENCVYLLCSCHVFDTLHSLSATHTHTLSTHIHSSRKSEFLDG